MTRLKTRDIDYLKQETAFRERVKEEAKSFKPCGQKAFSYARPSGHIPISGKGKVKASDMIEEDGEGVSVFEAYHVGFKTVIGLVSAFPETPVRQRGRPPGFAIFIDVCNSLSCFTLKQDRTFTKTRKNGNFWCCKIKSTNNLIPS